MFGRFVIAATLALSPSFVQQKSPPPACPDFTGAFIVPGEDGHVVWALEQVRCETLSINLRNNYMGEITRSGGKVVLDGVFRSSAALGPQVSGRIRENRLELISRTPARVTKDGKHVPESQSRYEFTLLEDGDLCHYRNWSRFELTIRAARLRGTGIPGERVAAERSGLECSR